MPWTVSFADDFEPEFDALNAEVQDAILARVLLLELEGPSLGRPHADTLTVSKKSYRTAPRSIATRSFSNNSSCSPTGST